MPNFSFETYLGHHFCCCYGSDGIKSCVNEPMDVVQGEEDAAGGEGDSDEFC